MTSSENSEAARNTTMMRLAGLHTFVVDGARAGPADVEFLQGHDVGFVLSDHRRHTGDVEPAIDADAPVDVPGHDPRHRCRC